jgi:putative ABC transport system substrate-binding protein
MRRREFITLLGGAAACPLAAHAQRAELPVIGFLGFSAPNSMVDAFRRGLAEAGYVDGQNVMIEFTGSAANLVRRQAAVIVATLPRLAIAAQAATSTIPIVFVIGADPVKYGLVASFNRPGGNVTGISLLNSGLGSKRLDLLLELIPQATTVAFLSGPPGLLGFEEQMSDILVAARALGRQIVVLEGPDFEAAFATLVERRAGRAHCRWSPTIRRQSRQNCCAGGALQDSYDISQSTVRSWRRSDELRRR